MKTFVITNTKGGVGKTTISLTLGMAFSRCGLKTAILDLDQLQKSAFKRGPDLGLTVVLRAEDLPSCQVLILDTPPHISSESLQAAVAYVKDPTQGRVLVVMPPAILDFEATCEALVTLRMTENPAARLMFNNVRTSSFFGKNRSEFSDTIKIPLLNGFFKHRPCYQRAMTHGWEALTEDALAEIDSVKTELLVS